MDQREWSIKIDEFDNQIKEYCMGDSLCKKPIFSISSQLFAGSFKRYDRSEDGEGGFVAAILESTLGQSGSLDRKEIGKEAAKASFLIVDTIQTRTRYMMRKDKKRAEKLHNLVQNSRNFNTDDEIELTASYQLLIRRACRNRKLLFDALQEIALFYVDHPYDELEEVLFLGMRALAHIDIMISLHKEQMALYCNLEIL